MRKDERCSYKVPRPLCRILFLARIQKHEIFSRSGLRMVSIGCVEVGKLIRGLIGSKRAHRPLYVLDWLAGADKFNARRFEIRHWEVAGELNLAVSKANADRK